MKILFVQDNGINESLALCELSGILKAKGHECTLFLEKEEKDILKKIIRFNPDLIIFPFGILGQKYAIELSKRIKSVISAPIVFAGSHPTFYPEIINTDSVDIVCIGEADYSIPELADKLENEKDIRKINGLWVKKGHKVYKNPFMRLLDNLDELPVPDREIYYRYKFLRNMPMKRFSSGRGCVHSCAYCFNHLLRRNFKNQRYTRKKSVDNIIEEIKSVRNKYPMKQLHFSDDLFTVNRKWVKDFCDEYKEEIDLPFTFNSTADLITSDIVKHVASAGCTGAAIGIETGNEELRKNILNKNISNRQIIDAGTKIKNSGMMLATFNMLGNPGENISDAFRTMKINSKLSTDNPRVTLSYPIKDTTLYNYAVNNGFLDKEEFEKESEFKQKVYYKSSYKNEFENLFYLFRIGCNHPKSINIIKKLIKLPPSRFFKAARILAPMDEKRFYNINILDGLNFYHHCGDPFFRTTNYTSVI